MKIIINGKEIEIDTTIEDGEKELDMLTIEETKQNNNMDETIELTEEEINTIKDSMGDIQ